MLLSLNQSGEPNSASTDEELSFLHAVEFSDVTTCTQLLEECPSLNVDVIDALGRTALRLAVRNENTELVELLLELCNSENIQQAALQAISESHTAIAELILKHPAYLQICKKRMRMGDTDGFFKTEAESQFSADITPLNLAAQKNNFDIVKLLLLRGESIQKPDRFDCCCMECRNRMKFDQLRMANFRLNAYRGLASEAYISLSTDDPILTAFQLAKELRKLSYDEVHFKKEYKDLAGQLSDYVVKLLDRVWTQQELQIVLNRKVTSSGHDDGQLDKSENLARLKMALENREKKFVAHSSVQQHLLKIWHRGLHKMDTYPKYTRVLFLLALSVVYPFIIMAYFVKPDWKVSKLAKQPLVKFLGHTSSFFFLLLLIIVSATVSMDRVSNKITLKNQSSSIHTQYLAFRERLGPERVHFGEDFPLRPHNPTVPEILISIWVAGMVVLEMQKLGTTGLTLHFNDLYNVVEFCLLVVYIAALVLFHLTLHMSNLALEKLQGRNVTSLMQNQQQTYAYFYWLNTDRQEWRQSDPINLAEGLFALANIISFSRIFYLLPANETLGPMQISLRRMINDIIKFLLIGAMAVSGFMISLRNLFLWYGETLAVELRIANKSEDRVPYGIEESAATNFYNLRKQFITVFWWIYGRGQIKEALKIEAKYEASQLTESVGEFLAALYHVTIIIVLVNLLIAMMARSFEKILIDVDVEWKYARSLLYMEYISDCYVYPVPFNILQPPRDLIVWLVTCIRQKRKGDDQGLVPPGNRRLACAGDRCYLERVNYEANVPAASRKKSGVHQNVTATSSDERQTYREVIQTIVQRFIFDIQREEELNKGKLEEARYNICRTKQELLELINRRNKEASHLTTCLKAVSSELSTLTPPATPRRHHHSARKRLAFADED
ncbi:hypothetical protein V1264_000808 [Littorina saxatilis]|uniref:Transient receptor ion channel domain-containing protein n=1 Tax=Littorina saxatilis TaxID=31220 RepID=A0AAN9C042_9CAEN